MGWKSRPRAEVIVKSLIVVGVFCSLVGLAEGYNSFNSHNGKGPKEMKKSRRDNTDDQMADETENSFSSRSQRADANYMRNYHYHSRPDSGGGWDGGRHLTSFGLNNLLSSGSSPAVDYAPPYPGGPGSDPADNFVAAGGHGHSSYGHEGGHGGGHGHGKDCNSALGLLGVLGLASYLQNVLRQMSTTAAPAPPGRRKREASFPDDDENLTGPQDVTAQILPFLMAIGHVREANVSVKCAYRPICLANKILTNNLGVMAKPVTRQLGTAIAKMLTEKSSDIKTLKEIKEAGKRGRRSAKCETVYPQCKELNALPNASMTLGDLL